MVSKDQTKILDDVAARARNLFESRRFMCAESVLLAINGGLKGDLPEQYAVAMAAPFSVGLGGSGCACGALSGGVIAIGLFLGNGDAYAYRKKARQFSSQLHDRFKEQFGSACCRVLCKKVKHDKKQHFEHCAGMTAQAARITTEIILNERPDLLGSQDGKYLRERDSLMGTVWKRITGTG